MSLSPYPGLTAGYGSVDKAHEIAATLRPDVVKFPQGTLELDRTVERVRDCGVLDQARGADVAAAITGAGKEASDEARAGWEVGPAGGVGE